MTSFLFVCTGNICRSPLAELAMRREASLRGLTLDIDSAATGRWNLGEAPDPRARVVASRQGLDASPLRARLVTEEDFDRFDHIIAMDRSHLTILRQMRPHHSKARLSLMLDHIPARTGQDVIDPYYGPDEGFVTTWEDVEAACAALARTVLGPRP
ncbi:low molecular weight protein-tyrosine-phosphatase [Gluconobacter oxydans]|uniref:low molecular weight protein-tyrosine-phosphatase n=1 Tax=Gluconobacter oxydans TaxID=442 RepID=UPI000785A9C1|nr:low molecular weight protein-tyrosine-phosphatase [Gluconobacter oxydans]KXV12153.1 phosphotyrosine protein phosphatase [Gluconobacter oxydans]MCP1247744.1 low molecular weight phosphotyrosine protein phosphatase [Gluconobacter oxydans]WKE48536.1 low molecular weight phosphotyrosine protein phosphatase [Gluconobacter oxydans]